MRPGLGAGWCARRACCVWWKIPVRAGINPHPPPAKLSRDRRCTRASVLMRRRERYFPSWTGRVSLFFHHGFYVSTAKPDAAGPLVQNINPAMNKPIRGRTTTVSSAIRHDRSTDARVQRQSRDSLADGGRGFIPTRIRPSPTRKPAADSHPQPSVFHSAGHGAGSANRLRQASATARQRKRGCLVRTDSFPSPEPDRRTRVRRRGRGHPPRPPVRAMERPCTRGDKPSAAVGKAIARPTLYKSVCGRVA